MAKQRCYRCSLLLAGPAVDTAPDASCAMRQLAQTTDEDLEANHTAIVKSMVLQDDQRETQSAPVAMTRDDSPADSKAAFASKLAMFNAQSPDKPVPRKGASGKKGKKK